MLKMSELYWEKQEKLGYWRPPENCGEVECQKCPEWNKQTEKCKIIEHNQEVQKFYEKNS
jgi:hypothetical protein